ncbi:MAG: hypothetical protein FJ245_10310 [Nitrospira sp.]|nr:hypothetical protein [Nitrospira sp.]
MSPDTDRPEPDTDADKARKLRRYSHGVSAALIVACNAVFLAGLWGSGVNLDALIRTPDVFDSTKDVCLRFTWHRVIGADEPIQLCHEWIDLSDPSGETHIFHKETKVVRGGDGKLYFDHGAQVDYRLFLLAAFVALVIALGVTAKRRLIARYRMRLDMQGTTPS